jgi:hypothetical protein
MRTNSQLKLIVHSPSLTTSLTDTSGNPSESYNWRQMAAVRRAWQQEYWRAYVNPFDLSVAEMMSTEVRVRRELYP